jgi:hypothetical protein
MPPLILHPAILALLILAAPVRPANGQATGEGGRDVIRPLNLSLPRPTEPPTAALGQGVGREALPGALNPPAASAGERPGGMPYGAGYEMRQMTGRMGSGMGGRGRGRAR